MSILGFGIIALIIVAFVLALAGAIIYYRHEEFPEADTEVRVFGLTRHTNGFAEGRLLNIVRGKERSIIEFQPYANIRAKKYLKGKVIESVKVVVENDKMIEQSRGRHDSFSNFIYVLPSTKEDFDQDFRKTKIGMAMSLIIENINLKKFEQDLRLMRDKVIDRAMADTTGLQNIERWMHENREIEAIARDKMKTTSPGRPPMKTSPNFAQMVGNQSSGGFGSSSLDGFGGSS